VDLDPERPGMRLPYGRLLREMGHLEESERQLRIALEQTTPDDDRTPLSLAETLIDLGRAEEAQKIIDPVLTRIPDHVDALAAKARLLIAQGRGSEAVPYLQKAAEGPELDPWVELGELYLSLGQPEKARASAGQALARANHPWALAVVGRALILEGRRDEGVATLEKALALRPRRPEAWLSLARAFTDAGQAREAALCRREAEAARRV
jgi:tetratricopeptide (TPR) repeat protein